MQVFKIPLKCFFNALQVEWIRFAGYLRKLNIHTFYICALQQFLTSNNPVEKTKSMVNDIYLLHKSKRFWRPLCFRLHHSIRFSNRDSSCVPKISFRGRKPPTNVESCHLINLKSHNILCPTSRYSIVRTIIVSYHIHVPVQSITIDSNQSESHYLL